MGKRKIKIKKKVKIAIYGFVLLAILSIYTVLNSKIFDLKEIDLKGNIILTESDIMKITSIELEKNLFQYKIGKLERSIKKNPYIKDVNIKRKFPNKLVINIEENTEDAIIENNNKYVYINKNGKILGEKKDISNKNIPIIKNVKIEEYNVGGNIKLKEETKQNRLLYLLEYLDDNNLKRDIDTITLEKDSLIMANKDGIDILLNLDSNISYNIKRLSQIMVDLKTKGIKKGSIDLRNKDQAVYSPL